MCGRHMSTPKDVYLLILSTREYVTLHEKQGLKVAADLILE